MSARLILGIVLTTSPFIFLFCYLAHYVLGWRAAVKGLGTVLLISSLMIFGLYLVKTAP